ncbi:MAG TPA: hypothetical protein VJN64_10665 [Terriglobales bacterium]|nr:hypothetical protein [Terriglobales bacterium]
MGIDPRWRRFAALCAVALMISSGFALSNKKKQEKPEGLIFGTAFGPDNRPLYGVKVHIQPVGKKHPDWDLTSDHHGEFAQRVPPGDYEITGEAEVAPVADGKPQLSGRKRVKVNRVIHVEKDVEQDISLRLE